MDKSPEKRNIPPILRKILAVDAYLSDFLVNKAESIVALRQLVIHHKMLEISCHGIPWLAGWLSLIWILNSKTLYQMQVNFFIGLIFDIIIIAVLKSVTRRRRPIANTDPFGIGPDKFSFPSGHASRVSFIVYFFINLWPIPILCVPPLLAWSTCICLSRVLSRKHYILDIVAGVILGIALGAFIGFIYLSEDTCSNFIYWITDEKLDGGEYHV